MYVRPEPAVALETWLRGWVGGEATVVEALTLDAETMARVARCLVRCVLCEIMTLPNRYRSDPPGVALLATLEPFGNEADAQHARVALREAGLAGGSATVCLAYAEQLSRGGTPEALAEAWDSLFYFHGPLDMAIKRTLHKGVERAAIVEPLVRAARSLATRNP